MTSAFSGNFFKENEYFIDQKFGTSWFVVDYKIYNTSGDQIGMIRSDGGRGISPFTIQVFDLNNQLLGTISRGWIFWMSKITIADANKKILGIVKQKFRWFSPQFHLTDELGIALAEINGDWGAWNFTISNSYGDMATITQKWAGVLKEVFTTVDKYVVSIKSPKASPQEKLAMVAIAIIIDTLYKQKK
ncbi:MAG TPA: phospholipid scramblase-related protein [Flavobacteriales bacterium]|nr:phospholipid scramblase-related protein [Flavobacteriales bacterium]